MSDQLKVDGAERDKAWKAYCMRQRELKRLQRAGKLKPKPKTTLVVAMRELEEAIGRLDEEGLEQLKICLNRFPYSVDHSTQIEK